MPTILRPNRTRKRSFERSEIRMFQHSPEITVARCSPYYSTLVLFQKTVTPFAIAFRSTIMNEFLLCCEMLFQIDESIFFEKKHVLLAYVHFLL